MVNLRGEFRGLLRQYGDKAILLSAASPRPCSCVNSLSRTGRPDCPACLGTGRLLRARPVYCRSVQSSAQDLLPKNLQTTSIGQVPVGLRQWYLEQDEAVDRYDCLIFCAWHESLPVFDSRTVIYRICNVDGLCGDYGRVEFLKISSQSDPLNAQLRLATIEQQYGYYLAIREVL
jgi:hypothetical protein